MPIECFVIQMPSNATCCHLLLNFLFCLPLIYCILNFILNNIILSMHFVDFKLVFFRHKFLYSFVVKGVVCKKNVAHRRMSSKKEKPQILILGGALEYQRVSNLLSSFDTLLQQVYPVNPSLFSHISCML